MGMHQKREEALSHSLIHRMDDMNYLLDQLEIHLR